MYIEYACLFKIESKIRTVRTFGDLLLIADVLYYDTYSNTVP